MRRRSRPFGANKNITSKETLRSRCHDTVVALLGWQVEDCIYDESAYRDHIPSPMHLSGSAYVVSLDGVPAPIYLSGLRDYCNICSPVVNSPHSDAHRRLSENSMKLQAVNEARISYWSDKYHMQYE